METVDPAVLHLGAQARLDAALKPQQRVEAEDRQGADEQHRHGIGDELVDTRPAPEPGFVSRRAAAGLGRQLRLVRCLVVNEVGDEAVVGLRMTLLAGFDDVRAMDARLRLVVGKDRVDAVAVGADGESDLRRRRFEKLAVVGVLVALDDVGVDSKGEHQVAVAVTARTELNDAFGGELLSGLLDVAVAVAVGAVGGLLDASGMVAAVDRLVVLAVLQGVAVDALGVLGAGVLAIAARLVVVVDVAVGAVGLGVGGVDQHHLAVCQVLLGVALGRVAEVAAVEDAAFLEDRLVDRHHVGLVAGVARGAGDERRIGVRGAVEALEVAGVAVVADLGNVQGVDPGLGLGGLLDGVLLVTAGADRRLGVALFELVEMLGIDVGLDVLLVTARAYIDDLDLVLDLRHDFPLRLEVRVVASGADRVAASVFLVLLEVVALAVVGCDVFVAALADHLHAHLELSVVVAVAVLAVRDVARAALGEHAVEVLLPDRAGALVADETLHRLVSCRIVGDVLEVGVRLVVAVDAARGDVDRTRKDSNVGVERSAFLSLEVRVAVAVQAVVVGQNLGVLAG